MTSVMTLALNTGTSSGPGGFARHPMKSGAGRHGSACHTTRRSVPGVTAAFPRRLLQRLCGATPCPPRLDGGGPRGWAEGLRSHPGKQWHPDGASFCIQLSPEERKPGFSGTPAPPSLSRGALSCHGDLRVHKHTAQPTSASWRGLPTPPQSSH